MKYITSVHKTGDGLSHWVMEGPLGKKIEWDAEATRMEPNKRIAWNSCDQGDITTSGQVTFKELPKLRPRSLLHFSMYRPLARLARW